MEDKPQDIVFYTNADFNLEVKLNNDTVWLSLNQISNLFSKDKSVISRHITNIFKEQELQKEATVAKNETVQKEGNRTITRTIEYFNLDVIISVGYRVNSKKGTQFRIWATNVIKEHIIKGYTKNENRLDQLKKTIPLPMGTKELLPGYFFGT